MEQSEVVSYVEGAFSGVDVVVASPSNGAPEVSWGTTFFICDPHHDLDGARRFPFATIMNKDYPDFDTASDLDRPGVFRLNIGVSKETFDSMFNPGQEHDFAALDRVMPHPVYGANHWVSVLNPSEATFATVKPLIEEAYGIGFERARPRGRA